MEDISEYWKKYEELNQSFKKTGRIEVSDSLENARSYINGLTDGWFEFLNSLKEIQILFEVEMSEQESHELNSIILELERNLNK